MGNMTIPESASRHSKPAKSSSSKRRLSTADLEDLKALDEACKRMKQQIPETPYILTVPTDPGFQYRHYSRQEADSWQQNTPFLPHEEHLQYMSFVYREHGDSVIVAKTEVDEERERRQRRGLNGVSSGHSTPLGKSGIVPKKKINLSDYKAKLAGNKAGTGEKKAPDAQKDAAAMNGAATGHEKQDGDAPTPQHGQKRSRDDRLDVKPPSTTTTHHDESSTPKRARLSASPPPQESQPQSPPPPPESRLGSPPPPEAQPESHQPPPPETRSESPPLNPHGLPPLQSPIRVAPIPYGLPPMLSPTLPAAVELELSRLSEHARNQPSTPSSAEKPAKKNPSTADPLANKIANSLKKSEVAIQRLSQLEDRQSKHDTAKEAVNTSHGNLLSESDIDAPRPARRQRFIVKLKYGKRHRKVVEQILRLPSKNSRGVPQARSESATRMEKSASQDTHRSDVKVPVTSHPLKTTIGKEREPPKIRKEIVNNGKSTTEKRKHQDDDARDQQGPKRQKALSGADSDKQPSTPLPAHAYSPSVGPQSAKSSAQKVDRLSATPRKDLRAVQMQRSTSGDSHVRTPQASGSTPGPRPTSAHNGRATEVEQWSALSKKYNDLGRKIKYEAQASAGKSNPSNADRKRSAVLALQCILSYVLAYHCQDTSSRLRHHACSLENTWISLLPMWGTFQRICQPFPQLDGLRFYLGVVIRNAIGLIMADRINIAKKAGADQPDAAPLSRHGSSDAPTPTPSASGSSASGVPPADWIRDNIIESGRCSREAAIKLSLKDLIAAFPATWAGSAPDAERPHVGSLDRDQDALLGGKYWLPLSADTTPVQGVRFGLRLLQEWAAKEGLDMEFALKSA